MPAVRIAISMPMEMIELMAAWPATFIRLSTVRKRGERIERVRPRNRRPSSAPRS
jgi:hypothetical protein